ncbi:outer membrane protein transport protein [Zunongwangia sp. SCSIO 43204]|uniref:OmpP1/FadL family transporter n=1 Tax=Zunongwangia sp. SCSIO 43204 TaxID=2779359 RepID=UPI001CAA29B7|nr:outer membrane protein transport protein [Zunongwangia sp. SCSIO 43204]UAB84562.1 outer membrane protein transport protein [Zunongwangia sp. SCSIO 43204]
MKKILTLTTLAFLCFCNLNAQDITDAFRYSNTDLKGTARFQAMSGAFGALGGDISAIGINPASSAVFLNSAATLTFSDASKENTTSYFNGITNSENDDFNLNQAGVALIFNSNGDSEFTKFSFGVNYSEENNFEDAFRADGTSNSSIDSYFLNYAQGIPLDLLIPYDDETIDGLYSYLGENEGFGAQQAFLGYQGYIIEPESEDLDNTSYYSLLSPGQFQNDYNYISTGLNGKISFNFAAEFQRKLYLGVNLNSHFINYDRTTRYFERNINSGSETNEISFINSLSTNGDGFSAQIGGIYKITDQFRIGATYDSPTWYNIREEATQSLRTYSDLYDDSVIVNPDVVNVYPEYTLRTPGKITGSAAIVLGGQGLISVDYSYKDFSNTEFQPADDAEFMVQNNIISETLKAASSVKIGGEYRINNWSLRGGYRYDESPYQDGVTMSDLDGYSAGIGYSFGAFKIDAAYTNTQYSESIALYQVGLTNRATIDREFSSLVFSLSFGL